MNCNTTHYRANSSSVPGDPTPEQAAGDAIDGRSDLYALGVIGYRMLSGRLPFDTNDMRELLMQHVAREPAPLDPGDSPELAAAVMRCLSKQPAARWASGSDIVEALRPRSRYDLRMPDDLEWVPSTLVSLTGLMVGTEIVTFGISRFNDDPAWLIFMAAAPFVTYPLVALNLVTNARKHGLPVRRAFQLAWMPPAKWAGWWPAHLRRPGDVWPRLPKIIRRVRTWFSAMTAVQTVIGIPFIMYALQQLVTLKAPPGGWLSRGVLAFAIGNVVLMLGVLATTVPWRRRFGVSSAMQARLLSAPTWNNPLWERPDVARLLLDSPDEPARLTSTSDLLGDIERAAAELPSGMGPAVQDALVAAREVARFVASLDQQIVAIDRDADPAEGARVAEKVAALRDGPSPMRSLLEQQLALHNELDARRRRLVDDRARAVSMLRRLRLELARSRSEFQRGETSAETLSGQIRAVCRDLERERDAVRTVEGLLEPTSSARVPTPR